VNHHRNLKYLPVAQKSFDTRGNTLDIKCEVTGPHYKITWGKKWTCIPLPPKVGIILKHPVLSEMYEVLSFCPHSIWSSMQGFPVSIFCLSPSFLDWIGVVSKAQVFFKDLFLQYKWSYSVSVLLFSHLHSMSYSLTFPDQISLCPLL
jgi:hypothetical protein